MKKRISFILIMLLSLGVTNVKSQVTIGSQNDPHPGAVLDLKSPNKGLLLPNVALDNTDLTKFMLDGESSKATAKGMLVYNTTDNQIYFWNGTTWGLVSGNGSDGNRISTNCPGVYFTVKVEKNSVSACPGDFLPTTIKITATGGSGNFVYGGDFDINGNLKSGISMPIPHLGGKALRAVITDGITACSGTYDFVIHPHRGCTVSYTSCPRGSFIVENGVYYQKTPGNVVLPTSQQYGKIFPYFTATNKDLCVYKRDMAGLSPWAEANAINNGCATGGTGNTFVDAEDNTIGRWRLPNIVELGQLQGTYQTYRMDENPYWSSTVESDGRAWAWDYAAFAATIHQKTDVRRVRCVMEFH